MLIVKFCMIVLYMVYNIHTCIFIYTYNQDFELKAKKMENNNEGFDKLHIILLIHLYALAQILQIK